MFRATLTRAILPHAPFKIAPTNHHTWKKVALVGVAGLCSTSYSFITYKERHIVHAVGHSDHDSLKHYMQEIAEHALWDAIGHVVHLGPFAAGVLGGLLSTRSLGEKDSFYIERPLSRPAIAKCMNRSTGKLDDCLILPNGREVVGQEIIQFYRDLQSAQILQSLERGRKGR